MVDCVVTNEGMAFWIFSVGMGIIIGWLIKSREIDKLNRKIKNLEDLLTITRGDLKRQNTGKP